MLKYYSWMLFFVAVFLFQCASVNKRNNSPLVSGYTGSGTFTLTRSSVLEGLDYQLRAFRDSISIDTISYLWGAYNKAEKTSQDVSKPYIENIHIMASVLKNRGYSVSTIQPVSYESIYALSKTPTLIWVIIVHFKDKKKNFVEEKDLTLYKSSLLSSYTEKIAVHLISKIVKKEGSYEITTYNGIVLQGLSIDRMNGQILSWGKDETASYIQIVDCFIVSLLPMLEIEEYIDEWYAAMPYTYVKPDINELN